MLMIRIRRKEEGRTHFSRHFNNCYWTEANVIIQIISKFMFTVHLSENSGHYIHEFLYPDAIPDRNSPYNSK